MRIAQVMAGAVNGGAELFFERMTLALARNGQDVLPIIRREPVRAAKFLDAGLKPVQLRFGGALDFSTKPAIHAVLRAFEADVAIAWMSRAANSLPTGGWTNIGRLGGYYDLKYYRACRYLVGNTHGIVDHIVAGGFPPERVRYLPNFVADFSAVEPAPRAALGVPEAAPLMLALGRLHKVKGFDTLIRAAALLPEVYCVIAGEGPERPALERLIAELRLGDRVKLLGWRCDTGALLKAADIFVSSARHEPLGNTMLEAFSAQTPVLATAAEGPSAIIRHGEDGLIVPIENPAVLADAAKTLLGDTRLRVKLALAARQRFTAEFSEPTVIAAWMDFLRKVAG
jgi:glycosyltransferase involved in cell wall biosynthesis